jgi:hypothetical protein
MPTLAKLRPLKPALAAAGIGEEDYQRDRLRPLTTMVGETPYVEEQAWEAFLRTVFARACFSGAGYAPHEHPSWCRPGVLPADLLAEVTPAAAAEPEPAAA